LPTSRVAARWVLDYQTDVQRRLAIAVITASADFAVEDFLCAGSVIDALSELGLDATSPEAAAAESAYRGLRNAVAHLFTAGVAGRAQQVPEVLTRIDPNASAADVTVIRDART
jgi:phosphosulfolactate phosphohydrolase-like enzyme